MAEPAQQNLFVVPPPPIFGYDFLHNIVYLVGSSVEFQWQTNYTGLILGLFQFGSVGSADVLISITLHLKPLWTSGQLPIDFVKLTFAWRFRHYAIPSSNLTQLDGRLRLLHVQPVTSQCILPYRKIVELLKSFVRLLLKHVLSISCTLNASYSLFCAFLCSSAPLLQDHTRTRNTNSLVIIDMGRHKLYRRLLQLPLLQHLFRRLHLHIHVYVSLNHFFLNSNAFVHVHTQLNK